MPPDANNDTDKQCQDNKLASLSSSTFGNGRTLPEHIHKHTATTLNNTTDYSFFANRVDFRKSCLFVC